MNSCTKKHRYIFIIYIVPLVPYFKFVYFLKGEVELSTDTASFKYKG